MAESISSPDYDIVLLGGGGGVPIVLDGLLQPESEVNQYKIAAILGVADSGGSTGLIRDLFGGPAVGDIRRALAMAADPATKVAEYYETRFGVETKITDVENINKELRPIALNAGIKQPKVDFVLDDMITVSKKLIKEYGSLYSQKYGNIHLTSLRRAHGGKIIPALHEDALWLGTRAAVIPSTDVVHQIVLHQIGKENISGEGVIDDKSCVIEDPLSAKITLDRVVTANPEAIAAIATARWIQVGPGSLFTSITPTLGPSGVREAILKQRERGGKLAYLSNLTHERNKTEGLDGADIVNILEDYIGRPFDVVMYNTNYSKLTDDGDNPVYFKKKPKAYAGRQMVGADLVDGYIDPRDPNDKIADMRSRRKHQVSVVATYLKSILG